MKLDSWLLEILACPNCGGALRPEDNVPGEAGAGGAGGRPPSGDRDAELVCTGSCGYAYPVRDDIPVLLVDEARTPAP
ncbi:Trm112 family protein [Actinomadura barringtoniae]|uniref:Trm112 family protein n=1 Tax=Actinomadura barringtoniae TaxID=1427535 RepID=A0A939P9J2_9ACTN|nr:Trm112 family protein [Actinomadura barringtoniae]MBO2448430.1 Trm112 family protein [Actinomadura barringtoniae]